MNKRKSAAAAALAAAAAAGMVTNTVVDQPLDLLNDTPFAVEEADDEGAAQEQKKSGPAARVRDWILSWHPAVRMLVALPLWEIGWVVLTGLSTFWMGASAPWLARVLGWLCLALMLLVVYTVAVKAAYPKASLKRLVRPGNVLLILIVTLILAAADLALPGVWEGYNAVSQIVWRVGAACVLIFCCSATLKRQGRGAQHKAEKALQRTLVEQEALRLADSVCLPRE